MLIRLIHRATGLSIEHAIKEFRSDIANNRESLDDVTNFCFTAYCKPLIPCIRGLHEVRFPGGNGRRRIASFTLELWRYSKRQDWT